MFLKKIDKLLIKYLNTKYNTTLYRLHRDVILQLAVRFGHREAITKLSDLFYKNKYDVINIDPNLRDLSYQTAMITRANDTLKIGELNLLFKKLYSNGDYYEKIRILRARSRCTDVKQIRMFVFHIQ